MWCWGQKMSSDSGITQMLKRRHWFLRVKISIKIQFKCCRYVITLVIFCCWCFCFLFFFISVHCCDFMRQIALKVQLLPSHPESAQSPEMRHYKSSSFKFLLSFFSSATAFTHNSLQNSMRMFLVNGDTITLQRNVHTFWHAFEDMQKAREQVFALISVHFVTSQHSAAQIRSTVVLIQKRVRNLS